MPRAIITPKLSPVRKAPVSIVDFALLSARSLQFFQRTMVNSHFWRGGKHERARGLDGEALYERR